MKRNTLAIIFACCTLALLAQDAIRVKYQGEKPTISDLAWAYLIAVDNEEEECGDEPSNAILNAWTQQREGLPLMEGETLTIDEKNGYVFYEHFYDSYIIKMEMCYWNEADGKHKLFAFNNMASIDLNDGMPILTETSGLYFWRYNNATKKMTYCTPPGFEVEYFNTTYALPCSGKNITVTKWNDDGTKTEKTLKWDGHKFSY